MLTSMWDNPWTMRIKNSRWLKMCLALVQYMINVSATCKFEYNRSDTTYQSFFYTDGRTDRWIERQMDGGMDKQGTDKLIPLYLQIHSFCKRIISPEVHLEQSFLIT